LRSIDGLVLPEPFSEVTEKFVDYVANAHSWYKRFSLPGDVDRVMAFNFFVAPGSLIESEGGLHERTYPDFQFLKYGAPGSLFDVKDEIPREIYDAGLAIVPGVNFDEKQSKRIMVVRVANMLQSIEEYRGRHNMAVNNNSQLNFVA